MDECDIPESLCTECAKHPSLKTFVASNSVIGIECGVCHRNPLKYKVCDPKRHASLSNLIRSLIRFYYDEWDYNSHWGGDLTCEGILSSKNPIVEHRRTLFHDRTAEGSEGFFKSLFWPPYPPRNEGVAVYVGYEDNILGVQGSISRTQSEILRNFETRLQRQNYFAIEGDVRRTLDQVKDRISKPLAAGEVFFRARIGVKDHLRDFSDLSFRPTTRALPFLGSELSAPPPNLARVGRLNRTGVSFLYLAKEKKTAVAEVRPHPGHEVSVGAFVSNKHLTLANFDADIGQFAESDEQLELFHFLDSVDRAMSLPIVPEEIHRYSITQLVADVARQIGFDGVAYKSALGTGLNACIFSPSNFDLNVDSPEVFGISSLSYETEKMESVLTLDRSDISVDR